MGRDIKAITFLPGLLLDSRDQLVLALLAANSVGVSLRRFDYIPHPQEMADAVFTESWVTVYRNEDGMFILSPSEDGEHVEVVPVAQFESAQANESAQFAIELALASWPEWGRDLRDKYQPRWTIPLPPRLPMA
jgi:hypothetical protein